MRMEAVQLRIQRRIDRIQYFLSNSQPSSLLRVRNRRQLLRCLHVACGKSAVSCSQRIDAVLRLVYEIQWVAARKVSLHM